MWSSRHQGMVRVLTAFAALTAAFVVMLFGTPAFAAPGAKGRVDNHAGQKGNPVSVNGRSVPANLIGVVLEDGTKVITYCVDFTVVSKHGAKVIEDDWAKYPNPSTSFKAKPEKVNWILHHSYPDQQDLTKLAKDAGADKLSAKQAISGTQLAIWHFSNGTKPDKKNDKAVLKLYEYLTGAKNVGESAQPASSLAISPKSATGVAGDKIGPFTVETSAKEVPLTVSGAKGVQLVDESGKVVTKATNGGKVYVKAPADAAAGKATVKGELASEVKTGRLFRGDGVKTQTLITATSSKTKVKASATATWKPKPSASPSPSASASASASPSASPSTSPSASGPVATPSESYQPGGNLPITGSNVAMVGGIGALLLAAGAGLFFLARKKRTV